MENEKYIRNTYGKWEIQMKYWGKWGYMNELRNMGEWMNLNKPERYGQRRLGCSAVDQMQHTG
jgi:hypothetical protein